MKELSKSKLCIRVPTTNTLEQIIETRFKSQFETKTSRGTLNNDYRARVESKLFNYELGLEPENRPIYGYLAKDETIMKNESTSYYGHICCKIDDSILSRTTFTCGDSLSLTSNEVGAATQPSPVLKPSIASAFSNISTYTEATIQSIITRYSNIDTLFKSFCYIEAQIHGRLESRAISEIHFLNGTKPTDKITEWAKRNQVPIFS
eukprot:TRINITY_DN197_c0_g2_i3.p1 TRINITY_DN197_c0_g2~~TRINITY_DN197_c0_g2_i3.p1  ORF type:complete len:206 (-),score=74.83 TRINITY_DN197_c0_g2_i3:128-745(-)